MNRVELAHAAGISGAEEMLIPFKNLVNDAYCRDISVKIRSQLDIKRKNGQYIGSFASYGEKKSPLTIRTNLLLMKRQFQ